jgi:hypothetical protein
MSKNGLSDPNLADASHRKFHGSRGRETSEALPRGNPSEVSRLLRRGKDLGESERTPSTNKPIGSLPLAGRVREGVSWAEDVVVE